MLIRLPDDVLMLAVATYLTSQDIKAIMLVCMYTRNQLRNLTRGCGWAWSQCPMPFCHVRQLIPSGPAGLTQRMVFPFAYSANPQQQLVCSAACVADAFMAHKSQEEARRLKERVMMIVSVHSGRFFGRKQVLMPPAQS